MAGTPGDAVSAVSEDMLQNFPDQLFEVCKLADLPSGVIASVRSWCFARGAARLSEIHSQSRVSELAKACCLKPFEADRFKQALEDVERLKEAVDMRRDTFWCRQIVGRPRRVIFVRHGESEANVQRTLTRRVPDHAVHLTAKGREQALEAGRMLRNSVIGKETVTFIVSPYVRTVETFNGISQAWEGQELKVREDVRIREMEHGNYDDENMPLQMKEKKEFGAFYYRFQHGESPADVYDRASIFLETLYRSWEDNTYENVVIVAHGTMILVLLMRFFRWRVGEFDNLLPLNNGEIVVLERPENAPKFEVAYTWTPGQEKHFGGLRRKEMPSMEIWDGSPDAPLLTSE